MKIGLSTWSLLSLDVISAVRAIGDAEFDYIELWGEVPHAYPEWVDRKKLRDALSPYKMTITMHAPFTDLNPATPFQPVKGAVERTLEDFVKLGDYLGASIITVHPGSVHNEALIPRSAESSVATLRKLVAAAGGRLSINVENQAKSRSKYHFPLASTSESLNLILAEVEGLHFTLDTGHANVDGQNPLALAESAGPKLTEVHLSDNGGASDDHLIPGEGSLEFKGLMERLAGTRVLVCLELDPHRYTPDRVLKASASFRSGV
ncbi:MAG TPA: sugar phosphate isomerase/epimerase, partial [Nitrososphaerales archaeon]|nr:sugar phosphate isomerase/epimerase [Nitrososphaerales archaeon]